MERNNRQQALDQLLKIAGSKGYVTVDIIMSCADDYSLSITDLDWLSSEAVTRNIIVYDTEPVNQEIDEDEASDGYSQSDYEAIYTEIVRISPELTHFIEEVKAIRPPQPKETAQLKYLSAEGNEFARKRMIEMHLRIALRLALQRSKAYDFDLEEAVSLACGGLIIAVDKYDPYTNGPFSSYASLWILQNMSRSQPYQNALIYFPHNRRELYYVAYPLLKERGCLECDKYETCSDIRQTISLKLNCAPDQVEDILSMSRPSISLNTIVDNESLDEYRIHSLYGDDGKYSDEALDEWVSERMLSEQINHILDTLTPREEKVIRLRFGFIDDMPQSLEEVGKVYNVTRERIRQIEKKAMKKLHHPSRTKRLKDYL